MHQQRSFPLSRPRRLRSQDFLRRLTAENRLSVSDLIMPLFICENDEKSLAIPYMPHQERVPLKQLATRAKQLHQLNLPAVALFPVVPVNKKTNYALEAYNPQCLIARAIQIIKQAVPELGVICDVALDPYTSHGQDGITNDKGTILNDATLDVLGRQSLCLIQAGCDVIAPSDMMDGRVGFIRQLLESKNYHNVPILAYTAKYASSLYRPFRGAIGSGKNLGKSDKLSYQMFPANGREALYEASLDLAEGADMIMVKPGNIYADIIFRLHQEFDAPIFAYQVSGEYSMLCHLGGIGEVDNGGKDNLTKVMMESLISLKRAGASAILTYFAEAAAKHLRD